MSLRHSTSTERSVSYVGEEESGLSGVHTLSLLRRTNLVLHLERLAGVDDIDDRAGSRRFEVLQECACVAAVRVGRIYALCREVV
jgi:hypothetical protein